MKKFTLCLFWINSKDHLLSYVSFYKTQSKISKAKEFGFESDQTVQHFLCGFTVSTLHKHHTIGHGGWALRFKQILCITKFIVSRPLNDESATCETYLPDTDNGICGSNHDTVGLCRQKLCYLCIHQNGIYG